jgi:hypothetical protein
MHNKINIIESISIYLQTTFKTIISNNIYNNKLIKIILYQTVYHYIFIFIIITILVLLYYIILKLFIYFNMVCRSLIYYSGRMVY